MRLHNTLSREKEELVPLTPGKITMYVCGPTVYNYFHIGNARPFLTFDALRRYLEYRGMQVTYVQNFTDVDDKMIRAANEQGLSIGQLADRFIQAYDEDAAALGIRPADVRPRATEHMQDIIALIQRLVDKGLAYPTQDGVYFDTAAFDGYGKLSGQDPEDREAGARIEVDQNKRNPMDFALWKARKEGEPYWDSPWGEGRPGWHVECSAMSMKYLGESFDIHAGGVDLIFPHHENEIAQSEAATGKPYANFWLHNGHINVDNQKMSKSKGNFFTVRDILAQYDAETVRFFLLGAHYRSPINFSSEMLAQAQSALERIYTAKFSWQEAVAALPDAPPTPEEQAYIDSTLPEYRQRFIDHLDDDFNTAGAVGILFELVREGNSRLTAQAGKRLMQATLDVLLELGGTLGLLSKEEERIDPQAEALAQQRQEARARKDWAEADRLRDAIQAMGYALKDTPGGYTLRKE